MHVKLRGKGNEVTITIDDEEVAHLESGEASAHLWDSLHAFKNTFDVLFGMGKQTEQTRLYVTWEWDATT